VEAALQRLPSVRRHWRYAVSRRTGFGRFADARLIEAGLSYAAMVGRDLLVDLSLRHCARSGRGTLEAVLN